MAETTEIVRETAYALAEFIAARPRTYFTCSEPTLHRALRALRGAGAVEHDRSNPRRVVWRRTKAPVPPDLWPRVVLVEHARATPTAVKHAVEGRADSQWSCWLMPNGQVVFDSCEALVEWAFEFAQPTPTSIKVDFGSKKASGHADAPR